jgi:hypothetical protein
VILRPEPVQVPKLGTPSAATPSTPPYIDPIVIPDGGEGWRDIQGTEAKNPSSLEVDQDRARRPEVPPDQNVEDLMDIQGEAANPSDLEDDQDRVKRPEIPLHAVSSRPPPTVEDVDVDVNVLMEDSSAEPLFIPP